MPRASSATVLRIAAPSLLLCLSGLAQAELTGTVPNLPIRYSIYGFVNAEVESVEAKGGATPYRSRGRVSDGNSRLGFSGSIDIDANARGVWQIEGSLNNFEQGGVNDQGSSSTLTSRNSFVGIEDQRFGRLIIGNNDSAYRSLVGSGGELGGNQGMTTHGLDLWNNTSAQMTGNPNSLFGRGEARYKNSVHYFSPNWAGFQGAASYGFDEALANGSSHARYALAAKYTAGPFEIGLGYDHQQNSGVDLAMLQQGAGPRVDGQNGVGTSFMKVIASYKLPTATYVGVGYERGSYGFSQFTPPGPGNIYGTTASGQMKQGSAMFSIAQDFTPKLAGMVSYGKLGKLSNAAYGSTGDYGATQISAGAQYRFNSYLSTYFTATRIQNKSLQSVNLGQSPLYTNNANTANAYLAPGNSPRAFGFGLIAQF